MFKSVPYHLNQTITDLRAFLKNPVDRANTALSTSGKVRVLLLVFLLDIAICMALTGVIGLIETLGWYNMDNHALAELMRTMPVWGFLLAGIVVVPFLEEFLFRYGLRFSKGYLVFFFVALLLVSAGYAYSVLPLTWALVVLATFGLLLILFLSYSSTIIGEFLRPRWARMYKVIFYVVALLFGFVHLTNFEYSTTLLLLSPLLVAPQLVGGLLFGYIRVRQGFFWGYALHAGHNAFFFTIALLAMNGVEEKINISNDKYALKVEEHMLKAPTTQTATYGQNDSVVSVSFTNMKLDEVIGNLLRKEQVSVQFGENGHLNRTINLTYKGYNEDFKQGNKRMLEGLQKLYHFDIATSSYEKEVWDMAITDSSKLDHHAVAADGLLKTVVEPKTIILENVTLNDLLKTVGEAYNVTLVNQTEDTDKYNFTFARAGFEQLKEELNARYGISVQARRIMAEQALVTFEK
ncbi:CPBP family glutamic-type intramembrane protease [Pontibacter sp. MBLB2868]|uniref:CPBP family glutamic-type intramembrane protease n=1 Tax=Pontibacter sp. MBLB2868 TaxID=3451555 RepID=UPI003F74ED97